MLAPARSCGSVRTMTTNWTDAPGDDDPDDLDVDEELEAQWEAEWTEAERDAVAVLRSALMDHTGLLPDPGLSSAAAALRAGIAAGHEPYVWIVQAAGLEAAALPDDDAELLIRCAAATISPEEETGLDLEEEATLVSLEHPDWLGAIVSTVRGGPGADASPAALINGIRRCPEVVLDADLDLDDESFLEAAFSIVAPAWHVLGITDHAERLTSLGVWLLPRALARAWSGDFDSEPDTT